MIVIKEEPRNKEHFRKLKRFCKQIFSMCQKSGIQPIAWGSLAYFGYTKDKNITVNDIDFLISASEIKKIMKILKEKGIKCKYIADWHSLVVSRGSLRIEFDPIEWYCKTTDFVDFSFGSLIIRVVSLDELIRMNKRASGVSKDKPSQHYQKYRKLKKIRS